MVDREKSNWRRPALAAALMASLATTACGPSSDGTVRFDAAADCAGLAGKQFGDAKVTAAEYRTAGVGTPHCRVQATLPLNTHYEVWIPQDWNGRLVFAGGGGYDGSVPDLDMENTRLRRGFAVVGTDSGHQAAFYDASWTLGNDVALAQFGQEAVHRVTASSKSLLQDLHGRAVSYSYFEGCSNGGRQGVVSAALYPQDFDGIVSRAPVLNWTGTNLMHNRTQQLQAREPAAKLTADAVALLDAAVLASCDALDGVADGVVSNPRACHFDPAQLLCAPGQASQCLTAGHVDVVKGLKTDLLANGNLVNRAYPWGGEGGPAGLVGPYGWAQSTAGGGVAFGALFQDMFLKYLAFDPANTNYDFRSFDIDRDFPRLSPRMALVDIHRASVNAYAQRGGKLLLWHGTSDPAVSALETERFHERVATELGSKAESSLRLYMAPGVQHCGGGSAPGGVDLLAVMQDWVEHAQAPGHLVSSGTREDGRPRSLPLCRHPKVPKYKGSGDPYEAGNHECVVASQGEHPVLSVQASA